MRKQIENRKKLLEVFLKIAVQLAEVGKIVDVMTARKTAP